MVLKTLNCKHCNKQFHPKTKNGKYCCRNCYNKDAWLHILKDRKPSQALCAFCGKEFLKKTANHKYCSFACGEPKKIEIIANCIFCGKEFSPINQSHVFCGTKCRLKKYGLYQDTSCTICGKSLGGNAGNRKYCDPCRPPRKRQSRKLAVSKTKCCLWCKTQFITEHPLKVFCSEACQYSNKLAAGRGKKRQRSEESKRLRKTNERRVLYERVGSLLRATLKLRAVQKTRKTFDLLGFSPAELKARLVSTLKEDWTWEDYLVGKLELDHMTPDSWHNYSSVNDEEFKKSWGLENLQLLPKRQNSSKRNFYASPRIETEASASPPPDLVRWKPSQQQKINLQVVMKKVAEARKTTIDRDLLDVIIGKYKAGESLANLSREYKITDSVLARCLRERHVTIRNSREQLILQNKGRPMKQSTHEISIISSKDDGDAFWIKMGRFFASKEIRKEFDGYPLNDSDKHYWFILTIGEVVVSFLGLSLEKLGSKKEVWITEMYTLPDHRQKGFSSMLLAEALEHIQSIKGAEMIRVIAHPKSHSHIIFKKNNFTEECKKGNYTYYQRRV